MLLQQAYPKRQIYFVKHGPPGHNLHTQWKAGTGPDYKTFLNQYNAAMADLNKRHKSVRVIGMYWDQGESDKAQADVYGGENDVSVDNNGSAVACDIEEAPNADDCDFADPTLTIGGAGWFSGVPLLQFRETS